MQCKYVYLNTSTDQVFHTPNLIIKSNFAYITDISMIEVSEFIDMQYEHYTGKDVYSFTSKEVEDLRAFKIEAELENYYGHIKKIKILHEN